MVSLSTDPFFALDQFVKLYPELKDPSLSVEERTGKLIRLISDFQEGKLDLSTHLDPTQITVLSQKLKQMQEKVQAGERSERELAVATESRDAIQQKRERMIAEDQASQIARIEQAHHNNWEITNRH